MGNIIDDDLEPIEPEDFIELAAPIAVSSTAYIRSII